MSNLPIACSLTASDLATVKQRYHAAASQYRATARIRDRHADISLAGDKAALRSFLDEMIERESDCCSFLSFSVTESSNGYNVRLTIVDGAGLEDSILRESVATFFPAATSMAVA
jgi:hypothetical protein